MGNALGAVGRALEEGLFRPAEVSGLKLVHLAELREHRLGLGQGSLLLRDAGLGKRPPSALSRAIRSSAFARRVVNSTMRASPAAFSSETVASCASAAALPATSCSMRSSAAARSAVSFSMRCLAASSSRFTDMTGFEAKASA